MRGGIKLMFSAMSRAANGMAAWQHNSNYMSSCDNVLIPCYGVTVLACVLALWPVTDAYEQYDG